MNITDMIDYIKDYIDKRVYLAKTTNLEPLFVEYKTKEVGSHINEILHIRETYVGAYDKYPTTRYDGSALQAGDYFFYTSTRSYKTYDGQMWVDLVGGQYVDKNKGIGYLANHSVLNEDIVIQYNTNAYSVDNYTLADGATMTVEDGAVYKIL